MKKILLLIALMIPASCFAQSQVKIALGATYSNGIINVIPLVFGQSVGTLTYSLDASGNIIIANLSQGRLHGVFVCKSTGTACLYTTVVSTGNTQDITSALSANPFGSATGTVTSSTMTSGTPTEASGANSIKNGVLADFITFGLAASSTLPFNVKSYGAKGDTNYVLDGVTNSTTTVTSATANFSSADVGKTFYAFRFGQGNPDCSETTIASVTNATTAVLSAACSVTTTASEFVYGHKDTTAIQSAVTAATAIGGTIYFPAGKYLCEPTGQACIQSSALNIGVIGDGQTASSLFLTPTSTFVNGHGAFIDANGGLLTLANISFYGVDIYYGTATPLGISGQSEQVSIQSVRISNFRGGNGSNFAVSFNNVKGTINDLEGYSNFQTLSITGASNFHLNGSILSNATQGNNLLVGSTGPFNTTGMVSVTNTIIDECASCNEAAFLTGATNVQFSNDVIYQGSLGALHVDGTSSAVIQGGYIGPYDSRNNTTGLLIDSGGSAQGANVTFVGSGTGVALNNAGTFNDNGGNSFTGGITNTGTLSGPIFQGKITAPLVATSTNCSSAASPAVCASAAAGSVVVAAAATTVVVNTTAVTANSQIFLMFDSSLGTKLGVTCNATEPALYGVSARTAATSFTITSTAPTTNPACFSYFIVN